MDTTMDLPSYAVAPISLLFGCFLLFTPTTGHAATPTIAQEVATLAQRVMKLDDRVMSAQAANGPRIRRVVRALDLKKDTFSGDEVAELGKEMERLMGLLGPEYRALLEERSSITKTLKSMAPADIRPLSPSLHERVQTLESAYDVTLSQTESAISNLERVLDIGPPSSNTDVPDGPTEERPENSVATPAPSEGAS